MNVGQNILNFISTSILQNPPVLLGLIAMIGLIAQKKPLEDIINERCEWIL